jgi:hypothetical protein
MSRRQARWPCLAVSWGWQCLNWKPAHCSGLVSGCRRVTLESLQVTDASRVEWELTSFLACLLWYSSRRGNDTIWSSNGDRPLSGQSSSTVAPWPAHRSKPPHSHDDACTSSLWDIGPPRLLSRVRHKWSSDPAELTWDTVRLWESVWSRRWRSGLVLPPDPARGCLDWLAGVAAYRATPCRRSNILNHCNTTICRTIAASGNNLHFPNILDQYIINLRGTNNYGSGIASNEWQPSRHNFIIVLIMQIHLLSMQQLLLL